MTDSAEERIRTWRHDLSNPLAAILAEAQLQLLSEDQLSAEVAQSFREIEGLARRMRDLLLSIT